MPGCYGNGKTGRGGKSRFVPPGAMDIGKTGRGGKKKSDFGWESDSRAGRLALVMEAGFGEHIRVAYG